MKSIIKIPRTAYGFCIRMIAFLGIYTINIWGFIAMNNVLHNAKIEANTPYISFLLFPCIGLFLLARWNDIKKMEEYRNKKAETIGFTALALITYLIPANFLYYQHFINSWLISIYIPFFLSHILLFLALFNTRFTKLYIKDFTLFGIMICAMLSVTYITEKHWDVFSGFIMLTLNHILPLIDPSVKIAIKTYSITMNTFKVNIGPSCSGIYSMAAFTLLFIITIYFTSMKERIQIWRALLSWLCGIIILFIFNIVRIVAVILIGAYYSPEIAMKLFHEYLGAVILLGLFFLYLKYVMPKIIAKH